METHEIRTPTNKGAVYKIDGKFYYREAVLHEGVFRNINNPEDTIPISSKPTMQPWSMEDLQKIYGKVK